jgi:ABC-type polysaccharide/polyol phosphate export permease
MPATKVHRWIERGLVEDMGALYGQRRVAWQLFEAGMAEQRRANGLGLISPFISLLIHVLVLGSMMSLVLGEDMRTFIPYFAISFAIWLSFAAMISHFSDANDRAIRFLPFPNISGHIVHLIDAIDFIVALALRLVAVLVIVLVVNPSILPGVNYPAMLLGLVASTLAGFAWSLPLAYLFDKVRLLKAFLPQILLMVSLVTPIFWTVDRLGDKLWLADWNPVFHLIEVVREPVMNGVFAYRSLGIVALVAILGFVCTALTYRANREQMVYRWLA